jgi:hypothetical protein
LVLEDVPSVCLKLCIERVELVPKVAEPVNEGHAIHIIVVGE